MEMIRMNKQKIEQEGAVTKGRTSAVGGNAHGIEVVIYGRRGVCLGHAHGLYSA